MAAILFVTLYRLDMLYQMSADLTVNVLNDDISAFTTHPGHENPIYRNKMWPA